jgi:hypothetical protein
MSNKKETVWPAQTNTGDEVDPEQSAEERKARNAQVYPEEPTEAAQ